MAIGNSIAPVFGFTGKVVMVTGGSRGLSYEMVEVLAQCGADAWIT
jgi:NAD(P)-dependent dehydrogenase (short-subunit alcohol dehydrogenase family)